MSDVTDVPIENTIQYARSLSKARQFIALSLVHHHAIVNLTIPPSTTTAKLGHLGRPT